MLASCHTFPFAKSLLGLCVLAIWATAAQAQQPQQTPTPPRSPDDVVRVYTELVQTDVMVFDKKGHFVKDLTRDNFELRVDGKPRPIQSFELITAGSDEESQLAAARGATTVNLKRPVPLDRGRIVFFYVDDFHMDVASFSMARKVIAMTESVSPIAMIPYDEAYEAGFEDMQRRVPDTTKLRDLTGWAPSRTLDDILRDSIAETRLQLQR